MARLLPSTLGGPGWRSRGESHAVEVATGQIWHPCGYYSEIAPLKEVLLCWPCASLAVKGSPNQHLMIAKVDLNRIRRQAEAIRAFYESRGIKVHMYRPPPGAPPNLIFMRDLFFATPEGAVLSRPASLQRRGEERFAAEALTRLGVPILATPRGRAWFEGADALWLDPETVLLGLGRRTNREGAKTVSHHLKSMGVKVIEVPLPEGVQHLLGLVNFIDEKLAAIDGHRTPMALKRLLHGRGFELLTLPPRDELRRGRGINFVTLGPRHLVMPTGCPGIRDEYEAVGVQVHELEISEYLKAGGGLGCLTGIIARAWPEVRHGGEDKGAFDERPNTRATIP